MTRIAGILRAISATPWAIQEEKLHAILDLLELRAAGGRVAAEDVARVKGQNKTPVARAAGSIAVLPLYGVVAQRMNMMTEFSGGTSTEKFAALFDDAIARTDVSAIVIDVDSPGGAVEGTPELAARIFAARGKKPITAVANSLMASAAYWIASACDEIVVAPLAQVGSIGVFTVHTDLSQAEAQAGVSHTIISAGKYKVEGNPFEPLSPDAKAALQDKVDDIYAMFTGDVAKYRGVSAKAVRDGYGQGRTALGRAAVAAGLADRVGTLEDVIASLAGGSTGKRSRMAALASARMDRAGEEAITGMAAGATTVTTVAAAAIGGVSIGFAAAAPHNDRFLLVGADDMESAGEMCETCGAMLTDDGICPNGHVQPDDDIDDVPPTDNQSATTDTRSLADGAAAAGAAHPPHPQAPAPAQELTVSATPTAPQNGAAPTVSQADVFQMMDLASAHGKTVDEAKKWIEDGKTVSQVQGELLAGLRKGSPPIVSGVTDRAVEQPFKSFGDQMVAIVQAGMPNGRRDPRLKKYNAMNFQAGSASGMNETVGAEGGFFVAPELRPDVIDPVYAEDPILSRVTRIPIGSNTNGVKYNVVDETSRATGSRWGGIQMYWESEAQTYLASKPKTRLFELNLKKLIGLAYLTEELTQDAPAAEALLTRAFQAEYGFMLTDAIFRGTGGGLPLGFLKSGALQTQAIEATQTIANSATFLALNIPKMLTAVPASLWKDVIWLYQPELLPYLLNASVAGSTAGAAVPVFVAMGGFTGRPFDMILGRPAFASELCEAVGTPGDLVACVPNQYHLGEKGGVQTAQSIHVKFLTDELTLRWTCRHDGAPVWRKPVTPYKGNVAKSPFVTLATRS